MSSKNSYMRKFVILQGRKTSYSDSNKTKGHVKIEVRDGKGKIAFNVEGLKHIDDADKIYRGYLVRKEQNQVIKAEIGVLEINKNGQCKAEWKVNPQSVRNSRLPLDKFQSIMVTMSSFDEDDQSLSVPLVGVMEEKDIDTEKMINELQFTRKEVEIEEGTHKYKLETKQAALQEIEENLSQENKLVEEYQAEDQAEDQVDNKLEEEEIEDEVTTIKNIVEMVSVEEKTKVNQGEVRLEYGEDDNQEKIAEYQEIEKINEELEVEPQDVVEEEEKEQEKLEHEVKNDDQYIKIEGKHEDYFINKEEKQEYQEEVDWFNTDFKTPYGYSLNKEFNRENRAQIYNYQITNYTLNILKFFEKVHPFRNELNGYEFWEIEYDENNLYRGFLPYYDYVVSMYYPYPSMYRTTTCQSLIKKYKHYIFGIVMENEQPKYYIYGIHGKFKSSEHPYRGSTGFTTWLQGKNYENDKLGYWLLHIDATTGRATSPLRTTRPR